MGSVGCRERLQNQMRGHVVGGDGKRSLVSLFEKAEDAMGSKSLLPFETLFYGWPTQGVRPVRFRASFKKKKCKVSLNESWLSSMLLHEILHIFYVFYSF